MADVFSKGQRSEIMSKVKGRGNAATELKLISIFRQHGIAGWRRNSRLIGRPDFVFLNSKVALFVDGCFWHNCPVHGSLPADNREFWRAKLERNRQRDKLVNASLRRSGWHIVRVWQHELRQPTKVARRISAKLDQVRSSR